MDPLPLHPVTSAWFRDRLGSPTDVQSRVWPLVGAGQNVLVTAPTGSGKTLAAFLVAIDRLLTAAWPAGGLRVLYVSPLKALNNDIRVNLTVPLAELSERFRAEGLDPPEVRTLVRSGDSPEAERRRLRTSPPEILITTPESLNILLTQKGAGALFGGLRAVIVDEIHAVIGTKRGTSLLVALERLVGLAGEFQRVGLSATVNPVALVAQALAGFDAEGRPRALATVGSATVKAYDVRVVVPERRPDLETGNGFWASLALELRLAARDRPTLVFTNSRRACEKLARLMNEGTDPLGAEGLAYSHHGSLSKELRREVETKLKNGELQALVATNSLELGIDIGHLDEVVLAETPRSAASAIQKVGRAGHRTGETSRARLYPGPGVDLVEAAVVARCIREQGVEPLVVPEGPLDVLAQCLLSILCSRSATADELFALVRQSWPYRQLSRRSFDAVVDMLAGRYEGTRIPELKPRVEVDAQGVWSAKEAVAFLLYRSGGTIPDRGYFSLRDVRTGAVLGELDEEFVWERSLGDRFALGAQVWKIVAVDDQAVKVEAVKAPPHIIPFWKAEDQDRSWFLAEKVGVFLAEAERALVDGPDAWQAGLVAHEGFSPEAARRLVALLSRERDLLGALPHRWRMVIEQVVPSRPGARDRTDADQYVVHTFWGARVNRPWAYALAQAWEDRSGYSLETYPGDDQVLILVPPATDRAEVLSLVTPANVEDLLRRRIRATGFFGARFRESAGRALLLPRAGFDRRSPLWQTRLKAKRLLEATAGFADFPILAEAWRQCLRDEFDLFALKQLLDEWTGGAIETWRCRTGEPSPFTEGLLWRQINEKMYQGDDPGVGAARIDPSLWDQLDDRPTLPRALVDDWEARWGRTAPGYAPETPADLADLLEVRIALSEAEWAALLAACLRDHGPAADWAGLVPAVHHQGRVGVARVAELWNQPRDLWLRWLEGRGPVGLEALATFWGVALPEVTAWVEALEAQKVLVTGRLTEGAQGPEVCLARTWDQLVRRQRNEVRQAVPVLPGAGLAGFLGRWQGLVDPGQGADHLQLRVGQLLGLPLAADLWEQVVLPTRLDPYRESDFDQLFSEQGLRWFGAGPQRLVLGFPEDRKAFLPPPAPDRPALPPELFSGTTERSFADLASQAGWTTARLTDALWAAAWDGQVSTTTFGPVRHGLKTDFRYQPASDQGRASARGFQRWSSARTSSGTWVRWPEGTAGAPSALDQLEDAKRRARQVLDRYGVVFRALLAREGPAFQWRTLFPALRLMELSGEVVGGLFWEGIDSLQFARPEALRAREAAGAPRVWVQHAQDPSSLCGLGLDLGIELPRRTAGTWLWWKGDRLVGQLTAGGKRVQLEAGVDQHDLDQLVARTAGLLWADGRTAWTVETLNDQPADAAPGAQNLRAAGFQGHGEKLLFWKRS